MVRIALLSRLFIDGAALLLALTSCSPRTTADAPTSTHDGTPDAAPIVAPKEETHAVEAAPDAGAPIAKPTPKGAETNADVLAYIKGKLPEGGSVEGEPPKIKHTVQPKQTALSIATEYLEVTEFYRAEELAMAIGKANPNLAAGQTIAIPRPLTRVLHDPKDDKLGWPEDKALRGVFVTGTYASIKWAEIVEQTEAHGLNAIVLDAKDYDGYVNYPTKAKIAIESGAVRKNIPDLARAIRYAHWHGIRIILRIPCFHDPWTDKHLPDARLSIRFTPTGKPIHVDWLDPTLTEAQDYAIELAKEGIEAGTDEIQLDYVRFPVHLAMKVAVLPQPEDRPKIIRDFVKRVHTVTQAAGVYLSLDFFGVAATGDRYDILRLGQDIAVVAPEADAISLMSYPSHYGKGYRGWTNPADHPEVVGIGVQMALDQLKPTGAKTIFRSWLQAFPLGVTNYNPAYVVAQAKSAESNGGVGWLMWSPGCEYSAVWGGYPVKKKPDAQVANAH